MKKQKHLTDPGLINLMMKKQQQAIDASGKAMLLIALVILNEEFKFGPKRLNRFVDRYQDTLDYYNESNDYQALLDEWNQYFYDYAGIKVLPWRIKEQ